MMLKSCDTVHVAKRCRELIPGLWTGDGECSWTSQRWHPWHVVLSEVRRPQMPSSWQCQEWHDGVL